MVMEILYPAARVVVPEARATLRPFVSAAFHAGMSLNEFYLEHVTKTTVTMRREDFFPWADRIYAHLEKAISPLSLDPSDPFLITRLPQERISIPDRFWGRFEVSYIDAETGEHMTTWVTYGFNEKKRVADVENDAYDYAVGVNSPTGRIESVRLSEMYKQW